MRMKVGYSALALLLGFLFLDKEALAQCSPSGGFENGIAISDISGSLAPHPTDPSKIVLTVTSYVGFGLHSSSSVDYVARSGVVELWVQRGWTIDPDNPEGGSVPFWVQVSTCVDAVLGSNSGGVPPLSSTATNFSGENRHPAGGTINWKLTTKRGILTMGGSYEEFVGPTIIGSCSYGPEPGFDPGDGIMLID